MHMKEKESERREVCESSSHDKFERYVDVTLRHSSGLDIAGGRFGLDDLIHNFQPNDPTILWLQWIFSLASPLSSNS